MHVCCRVILVRRAVPHISLSGRGSRSTSGDWRKASLLWAQDAFFPRQMVGINNNHNYLLERNSGRSSGSDKLPEVRCLRRNNDCPGLFLNLLNLHGQYGF